VLRQNAERGSQLFDYSTKNNLTKNGENSSLDGTVWDHTPLHLFSSRPLLPFSYSMLAEILRRGWYNYYSRIGFDPKYGANLCRHYQGIPYLNVSISAKIEAEKAGVEPLTLRINGEPKTVASAPKRGLLAGITDGRAQRKIASALQELQTEIEPATQKAKAWYQKTCEVKWSQAEILQVMEEIERFGTDSLTAFFAARHNIELLQNRLLWALQDQTPFPKNLALISTSAHKIDGTIEQQISQTIAALRAASGSEFDTLLTELVKTYPHRCFCEGNLSLPRWAEDRSSLRAAIESDSFCREETVPNRKKRLLEHVDPPQKKQAAQWFDQLEPLYRLESSARNAFAYIQAGTHNWAKAAVQEAMSDDRILNAEDVYLFELEQIKQMMTGEWNVSAIDEIQEVAKQQRINYTQWKNATPATLLVNDTEVTALAPTPRNHFWLG